MKRIFKFLIAIILLLIASFIIFFFWASSPNFSEKDYANLIVNNYEQKIDTDSIYSIVTYNIGYLSGMTNNKAIAKPKDLYADNLKKVNYEFDLLNVDIIAFQEIDYASERSFKINQQDEIAKLGYNFIAQAVNWDETYVPFPYWPPSMHFGEMLSGQSIISKYPIKNHKRIVLERVANNPFYRDALYLERLAQVVTITIENKDIIIINIHLEAFDKITRVKQFGFVLDLFNEYAKEYPTILLGDFNSEARNGEAIIQKLFSIPEIGNAAFDIENPENTYDTGKPFKRIDYIFYTKNSIEYIDGKVLSQFEEASDHLPVEMRFKLR
jgi:endonuclease/exonuclease/phosphatase family metal-dependent hydrolase